MANKTELTLAGSSLGNGVRKKSRGSNGSGVLVFPDQHHHGNTTSNNNSNNNNHYHPFNRLNATQNNISSDDEAYLQQQHGATTISVTVEKHHDQPVRHQRLAVVDDDNDSDSNDQVQLSAVNAERARKFAHRLAERDARTKRRITTRPPTPTSSSGSDSEKHDGGAASSAEQDDAGGKGEQTLQEKQQERMKKKLALIFGDDPLGGAGARKAADQQQQITIRLFGRKIVSFPTRKAVQRVITSRTIDPQSYSYIIWLTLVTAAFLYNAFTIPLRTMFHESSPSNWQWFLCDYLCDFIFVERGILYEARRDAARHYFASRLFVIDLVSLLPLDLLYFAVGVVPALRLPRLLKIHCYWECFKRIETAVSFPNLLRILKTEVYLIYMVHLNAGLYYRISHWEVVENHEKNKWLLYFYEAGEGQSAYIRCFFHSLKIAAKISRNPPPLTTIQRVHQMSSHFFSIWIFAVLVGQIEDIYEAVTGRTDEFRLKLDKTLRYLKKLKMPTDSVRRARAWFIYSWKFQKALDENEYLAFLPRKLQTDLAINVHFNTIAKITLFHDVEQGLLRALVSSLRPRMYLPGEYVCKKGQVGKEMFIVKYGLVEILGGPQNRTVFATLGEGTVIGEIALLSLAGGDNRRTADVRSKGVSQLFVLSKRELDYHLRDYPAAERLLKKKAKLIMKQNTARRREAEEKFERELEATTGADHRTLNTASKKKQSVTPADVADIGGDDDSFADSRGENQFAKLVIKLLPQASALRQKLSTSMSPSVRSSAKSSLATNFVFDTTSASPARRGAFRRQMSVANHHRLMRVVNAVRFVSRTASARRQSLLQTNEGSTANATELSEMDSSRRMPKSNQIQPLFTVDE